MSAKSSFWGLLFLLGSHTAMATEFIVTHPGDKGPGSLRHAIQQANQQPGEDSIRFVSDLFQAPYTLSLTRPLPDITDDLVIDGYIPERLWQPSGITLDGNGRFGIMRAERGAQVTLRYLSLTGGRADLGGAIYSEGNLVLDSVLISGSQANKGGALFQKGGTVTVINSTLMDNQARYGGAIYSSRGQLTLTHNTITANAAEEGSGLYREGPVQLGNNIIALNLPGADAYCQHNSTPDSHANLIITSRGCGKPAFNEDPRLGPLGYYNGPTRSLPLQGNSPVINQADNRLSVDADGEPLVWDQRGNGDPRFAGGIADMGAFEKQAVLLLEVDTLSDEDIRGCTRLSEDCSLRGAIALLNASEELDSVSLDADLFVGEVTLALTRPLPLLSRDAALKFKPGQKLLVKGHGGLQTEEGVTLTMTPPVATQ